MWIWMLHIYRMENQFLNFSLIVNQSLSREENKRIIVSKIIDELKKLLYIND